jgi:hypothetical protein
MPRSIPIIVLTLRLLSSCGGGQSTQPPNIPSPCSYPVPPDNPTSGDPWYGVAGNVLVSDCGYDHDDIIDYLWIGFSSNTKWEGFLNLNARCPAGGYFICGQVMALPSQPLGFYFNPDTTGTAEVTIPESVTSIDAIKSDPAKYAEGPRPFGLAWCISAKVERNLAFSP